MGVETVPPVTPPSRDGAVQFIEDAEAELLMLSIEGQRADWVFQTNINADTELLASSAGARIARAQALLIRRARSFRLDGLSGSLARKFGLLPYIQPVLSPTDPERSEELAQTITTMSRIYSTATFRPRTADRPLNLTELSNLLATERSPAVLEEVWMGWHATARPMRASFERYVALANAGAQEAGFEDTGVLWRSKYELPAEAFSREVDRLWSQLRPLYELLHAYVRNRLRSFYGPEVVPERGPIPNHLLGNMWAQNWEHIYPLVAPAEEGGAPDITEALQRRSVSPTEMVRLGERFFVSLGFDPLPESFWSRSQFVRPPGREVVCHASAWDLDYDEDLRLKACFEPTAEDLHVVHHELGHTFYQRAYRRQPFFFRDSANDGFHEAVGDTVGLSVTPAYLREIGLLDHPPAPSADLGTLLRVALAKLAFLPFGLLVDKWRWVVFSGEIAPERYNASWWEFRHQYQGVAPPSARTEVDFDPGAKSHIPSSVPYMRYFLAHILEFQFHRAFARLAGHAGPLHQFSIYGNREVGHRLIDTFKLGQSRPWPEALELLTGEREMDGSAVLDYFEPLSRWLREETRAVPVGW